MKKVRKAVIPAAGLGTRVLPASKAMPKEMLPIVDKPAIQYIVEEAVSSGIEDILIITSRGKGIIEDHFDRMPELEDRLLKAGKQQAYDEIVRLAHMANISYIRQVEIRGLGDAILCAKAFVGDEPFAVLYGDDVIISDQPVCRQLCDVYETHGKGVVGIQEVSEELVQKYCSMKLSPMSEDRLFSISDMIEKPKPEEIFSRYAILGRCVLPPEIFDLLEKTPEGAGGEIQLTDAMRTLAQNGGMLGVDFIGHRYDMGNKLGVLQAIIEAGLRHPEIGADFRAYLKDFSTTL